jgi:hypothetical protein
MGSKERKNERTQKKERAPMSVYCNVVLRSFKHCVELCDVNPPQLASCENTLKRVPPEITTPQAIHLGDRGEYFIWT